MSTKPWEEAWVANHGSIYIEDIEIVEVVPDGNRDRRIARAKLAAQAPAMAKFIMDLEWFSQDTDEGSLPSRCTSCEVYADWDHITRKTRGVHKPDCEWLKLMKATGIVE